MADLKETPDILRQPQLTAKQFLSEVFSHYEKPDKLNRFYLKRFTLNIDKMFIIDLCKIKLKLMSKEKVISQLIEFVSHFVSKSNSEGKFWK